MFSGRPSVSACDRASVHPGVRPVMHDNSGPNWMEFHQTLVDDVVRATDYLIKF